MKNIKPKDLDNCMAEILNRCNQVNAVWKGESLCSFAESENNMIIFRLLESREYIRLSVADDGTLFSLTLLDDGFTYFLDKSDERNDFLKTFFSQFISGFVSGILVTVLGGLLLYLLTNK